MKRFFILAMILLMVSISFAAEIPDNDVLTGTTTNDYVETTIYIARELYKTILIKNTGDTNSITFYLRCYPAEESTAYVTFASGALAAAAQAECFINNKYYKVIIGLKSTGAGSHSTYSIDYIKE